VTEPGNLMDLRRSMVRVRIGNREYDAAYVPTCHTCTHPARMWIEEQVLTGWSFRAISARISEVEVEGIDGQSTSLPAVSFGAIRAHFQSGHMPLGVEALRQLSEKRAKELGSTYEEAAGRFVDHVVLAEAVIARTHERLVLGDIEPEVKDGLAAAKFLAEQAAAPGDADTAAWSTAMTRYFETARQMMDDRTWNQFAAALASDPILRRLAQAAEAPDGVVDAEVVAIEKKETP
jgi:hypothetical protein